MVNRVLIVFTIVLFIITLQACTVKTTASMSEQTKNLFELVKNGNAASIEIAIRKGADVNWLGVFRRKLWAYPVLIGFLIVFSAYQIYRYTFTRSIGLVLLTVFDLVIVWLTWMEYRKVKKRLGMKQPTTL